MRLRSSWTPKLKDGNGTLAERLAAALAADIAAGILPTGRRLPPHREVADALGIAIGTVTRAYAIAQRSGLVMSVHGRGTFVSQCGSSDPNEPLDLGANKPPPALGERQLAAALAATAKRIQEEDIASYAYNLGRPDHRRAAAKWLFDHRVEVDAERLAICNGAQHALSLAFGVACRPGDTILTEAATFFGVKTLASHMGYRLHGLAMDDEGMRPDALEAALRRSTARAVYVMPTLQNPTARTMGRNRRREIVALCRRYDATIIEDDVHSALASPQETTLLDLAPERTLYVNGLSKSLSPGLRIGFLVYPGDRTDAVTQAMRATCWTASPIAAHTMATCIADGTAALAAQTLRREAEQRVALAAARLPRFVGPDHPPSFHIWLEMPEAEAERFARQARDQGIRVTPPSAPIVEATLVSGVRLCLGAAPSLAVLDAALTKLATLPDERSAAVV